MDLAIWILWGGAVMSFLVATLVGDLGAAGMRPTTAHRPIAAGGADPTAAGEAELLHTRRRGRARVMVWRAASSAKHAERYVLGVERRSRECRDCMSCVNEAVEWMDRRRELLRR